MIRNRSISILILIVLALAPTYILAESPSFRALKGEGGPDLDHIEERRMSWSNEGDYDEYEDPDKIHRPNIETELQFITHCQDWLLPKTNNEIISQDDFADFLVDVCDVLHDEDLPDFRCPTPAFTDLAIRVQFLFARYSCDGASSSQDISQCLESYSAKGEELGLVVKKRTRKDVESTVFEICCGLLSFLTLAELEHSEIKCPTMTPIEIPPTSAPTKSPSISSPPTPSSTTSAPTPSPSTEPSTFPVDAPTLDPSQSPSRSSIPTIFPTVDETTILPTVALVTASPSSALDPINTTAPSIDPGYISAAPSKSNDDPSNLEDEPSRPAFATNRNGGGGLSAGTIAGFALGAGGLCILGVAFWRRLFDNSDEDEDTD